MVNNFLYRLSFLPFPGLCLLCDLDSKLPRDLCAACAESLPWIDDSCRQCGIPFNASLNHATNHLCANCQISKPDFDHCISCWHYEAPLSHWIPAIKYQRQLRTLRPLCELLSERLKRHYGNQRWPDCVIPTPLHWRRLVSRGFNQAELIATQLGRQLPIKVKKNIVSRKKHTPRQQGLSGKARRRNLQHAFHCKQSLEGKHIAVIDDIVTTGATVNAISRVLKQAGAQQVDVWCLARTALKKT